MLYSLEAIENSIREFSSFFSAKVTCLGDYIEVELNINDPDKKNMPLEFSNYVLGLMRSQR